MIIARKIFSRILARATLCPFLPRLLGLYFTHPPPLGGADAYMFYRCFCLLFAFFPSATTMRDTRSWERLNGFS